MKTSINLGQSTVCRQFDVWLQARKARRTALANICDKCHGFRIGCLGIVSKSAELGREARTDYKR